MSYTLNRFHPQDPSYPRVKRGRYNEGGQIEVSKFHRVTLHSRFDPLQHNTEHFQPFSYYGRYVAQTRLVEPVIEPPPMTEEQQRVTEVGYHQLLQTERGMPAELASICLSYASPSLLFAPAKSLTPDQQCHFETVRRILVYQANRRLTEIGAKVE